MGVRFIAVTDNFDSMNVSGQNETLSVNLKNLVNEMYAKDIAEKLKSSRKIKREQGSFTGGVPAYGYRAEWIGDKKCLVIDENAAPIVRKIFELFLSGKNRKQIVEWLYESKVVRPIEYQKTGKIYCQNGEVLEQWAKGTIKTMLINPVYMGCLVQGGLCGRDYRLRNRQDIDSEDWSIKEHAHEGIISEDMFFEVAEKFEKTSIYCNKYGYSKQVPIEEAIFSDVLYCGECGTKMKRTAAIKQFNNSRRVRTYSYNCPNASRIDVYKCERKSITQNKLVKIVLEAIKQEFALSAMCLKDITDSSNMESKRIKQEWNHELMELEKKIENEKRFASEQYIKYKMGEIEADIFIQVKEENNKKVMSYKSRQREIEEKLRAIDYETVQKNHFLRTLVKGTEKSELTAEVVRTLISRIEVYPDHRVKVIFAFKRKDVLLAEKEDT